MVIDIRLLIYTMIITYLYTSDQIKAQYYYYSYLLCQMRYNNKQQNIVLFSITNIFHKI